MQKLLDYIKKIFNEKNMKLVKKFCLKNKRYFAAAVLFVILVLILVKCTGPAGENGQDPGSTEEGSEGTFVLDESFEQDSNEALNTLITSYLNAYAADDLEVLEALAEPMSDNEKSYIGVFSQYIEGYQNISCYSKNGPEEGSYLVSVYFEMKFYNVDTLAPGLEFFYVGTNDSDELYINNLYSSYNLGRGENELDPTIYSVILAYEQQEDVIALLSEVETKYSDAVASDVNLATMITTTIPTAMREWTESLVTTEDTQEPETSADSTEDQGQTSEEPVSEEQTPEEQTPAEEEPATPTTVYAQVTAGSVNVRASAGTDGEFVGSALQGEMYRKLGTEGDWTQIDYNGVTAYIKTEFIQEVAQ